MIYLKNPQEIEKMRNAGRLLAAMFMEIFDIIKPGTVTAEIDRTAEDFIRQGGAKPAFKGYRGSSGRPYPATTCISIDREVVHGIPSRRKLKEGQIVGIDAGLELDGWFADMSGSFLIGNVSAAKKKLWRISREALYAGIERARVGNRVNDIGDAIQGYAAKNGFSVIRDLIGHGIGSALHEDPAVPNYRSNINNDLLKPGMTLAIEPMLSAGDWRIKVLKDGWTAVTRDGAPSGHFEHTVLITEGEPEILTLLENRSDPWLIFNGKKG